MKKKLFVMMALVMVLALVAIPAAAGPPGEASGTWEYALVPGWIVENVGCNEVWITDDIGDFTGTFEGEEAEHGIIVWFCNGKISYKGHLTFDGTVVDESGTPRSGTLEMRTVGTCCHEEYPWEGTWTILSGTDGLENLRGHGTWFGPPGFMEYEGNYHFEPD